MVCLVQTIITGGGVIGGGVATHAFFEVQDDSVRQVQINAVASFWEACAVELDESVSFQVSGEMKELNAADGALIQVYSLDSSALITGSNAGNMVPKVAQALIRWRTNDVENGRVVKGRTFIPGVSAADLTDAGGLNSGLQGVFADAAQGLIEDSADTLVIWHRPGPNGPGSEHRVTGASCWDQFAMLSSRRD